MGAWTALAVCFSGEASDQLGLAGHWCSVRTRLRAGASPYPLPGWRGSQDWAFTRTFTTYTCHPESWLRSSLYSRDVLEDFLLVLHRNLFSRPASMFYISVLIPVLALIHLHLCIFLSNVTVQPTLSLPETCHSCSPSPVLLKKKIITHLWETWPTPPLTDNDPLKTKHILLVMLLQVFYWAKNI